MQELQGMCISINDQSSELNVVVECKNCFKYYNPVISGTCILCKNYSFHENILCDLTRSVQETCNVVECYAYKPNLSAVGEAKNIYKDLKIDNESMELSEGQKWLKACALQQLKQDPDKVFSSLNYHVCLITEKRKKLFSTISERLMESKEIFDIIGGRFNATLTVLCVGYDHMHLHVESSPDYSADEVISEIIVSLELVIKNEFPKLFNKTTKIFENAYFAETIGL